MGVLFYLWLKGTETITKGEENMTFEQLKKQLEAGKITQSEFEAKCKELGMDKDGNRLEPQLTEDIKAYINTLVQQASQSSADRVRTEYSLKLKAMEEENKRLQEAQKNTMTDAEKQAFEFEQSKKEFEQKQAEFLKESRKFKATQILSKHGLLDDNLSFLPFVTGETEEEMSKNVELLKASIDKNIENKVQERFKASGRDLGGSGDAGSNGDKQAEFGKKLAKERRQEDTQSKKAMEHYFGEQ